jgi:SAM-dependent methyltransferase
MMGECPPLSQAHVGAGIVVDMHDLDWPVIRRAAAPLAERGHWYLTETRAFFAVRAASWDTKFGDDLPAYAAAVAQAGIPLGGTVADVGCGTGRALPALRRAVGPDGTVIAIDVTPEMLREARAAGRGADAGLVRADARRLPLADASADAVFAAGLPAGRAARALPPVRARGACRPARAAAEPGRAAGRRSAPPPDAGCRMEADQLRRRD